jgi:hypothetical protein
MQPSVPATCSREWASASEPNWGFFARRASLPGHLFEPFREAALRDIDRGDTQLASVYQSSTNSVSSNGLVADVGFH